LILSCELEDCHLYDLIVVPVSEACFYFSFFLVDMDVVEVVVSSFLYEFLELVNFVGFVEVIFTIGVVDEVRDAWEVGFLCWSNYAVG